MGLTERHLLNDEGGAWEPIGGWTDKPNLSPYPQPVCCENIIPNYGPKAKYPRKEYIALLDVMYQAIDDYKDAANELRELEARGPQRTLVSENDVAIDYFKRRIVGEIKYSEYSESELCCMLMLGWDV